MIQINLFIKQKQTQIHRLRLRLTFSDLENEFMVAWGEGIVREFGMDKSALLYLKWITYKDLLYNTWKSAQCYVPAWMERGLRENGYMYMHD